MKWVNTPIKYIVSNNVIYYDRDKAQECERICKILNIDCFPDLNEKMYWTYRNSEWNSNYFNYCINSNEDAFSERLLELMKQNSGNMIFIENEIYINGIVHFTDFDNLEVFKNLFSNIHLFERCLRSFLHDLGFNYEDFILYFKYQISHKKGEKYYNGQIQKFESEKFKEKAEKIKPLEYLDFSDLIRFSVSSYHKNNKNILEKIGLKETGVNVEDTIKLRNTVMHSKDISGENEDVPHDFGEFIHFYKSALEFRKLFKAISKKIKLNKRAYIYLDNKNKLTNINQMKNDQVIKYFYN